MALAYAAIGNWLSVKQPFKMQFYRFASGGSAIDALMAMIFASIPAALTVLLLWKVGIVTLIYLVIYLFFLTRAARILEQQREEIRRALT
jgi:beta-lactamase regulating signal transducer with metallopeptidase domain